MTVISLLSMSLISYDIIMSFRFTFPICTFNLRVRWEELLGRFSNKILKNEHDYEATLLLANGVESENEGANLHARVNSACNKFLSTNVQYLGHVVEDSTVKESAKKYKPIVEAFPSAKASVNFRALAKAIASI